MPCPCTHLSQGVRKGPFVQVSGQGPVDPATNEYLHPGDVAAQTTRTLQNVKAIIDASGASFDDVVMLRVYLTKREDFAAMNDAYGEFVLANTSGAVLPCRTTFSLACRAPRCSWRSTRSRSRTRGDGSRRRLSQK